MSQINFKNDNIIKYWGYKIHYQFQIEKIVILCATNGKMLINSNFMCYKWKIANKNAIEFMWAKSLIKYLKAN